MPRIDIRALLGLYDPEDSTDWGPIRAAQLNAGAHLALFLLGVNVVSAALVTLLARQLAPGWLLAGWAGLVTLVSTAVALRRLASRHRPSTTARVRDVRATMLEGIGLAAIWSVIPLAIGPQATAGAALGLWVLIDRKSTRLNSSH